MRSKELSRHSRTTRLHGPMVFQEKFSSTVPVHQCVRCIACIISLTVLGPLASYHSSGRMLTSLLFTNGRVTGKFAVTVVASLLSVAGKILARVMLRRLLTHVVDIVMPESQCGFRRVRSTADMIFVARLLQEKCHEQNQDLFVAFIDLTKVFDTVKRELLWQFLSRFGCPPNFLAVLQEFHSNMKAKVAVGGQLSDPFDVLVGVKQGCVLAPVIFNLFLVAVTPASGVTERLGALGHVDTLGPNLSWALAGYHT